MAAAAGSTARCNRNIAFDPLPSSSLKDFFAALIPAGLNSEMMGILIAI
jgi:hypothetical protein